MSTLRAILLLLPIEIPLHTFARDRSVTPFDWLDIERALDLRTR